MLRRHALHRRAWRRADHHRRLRLHGCGHHEDLRDDELRHRCVGQCDRVVCRRQLEDHQPRAPAGLRRPERAGGGGREPVHRVRGRGRALHLDRRHQGAARRGRSRHDPGLRRPSALEAEGANLFTGFEAAGALYTWTDATKGLPGEGGLGTIDSQSLELSNVDLTEEFAKMITMQRSFQASSRIVTVSDTVLEEIVNMKR
ncbi:hypothetical protein OH491_11040 [Termitidicoccus mucosus]